MTATGAVGLPSRFRHGARVWRDGLVDETLGRFVGIEDGDIGETLKAMEWKPPSTFNMPPRQPIRDVSLPEAWSHLEKSRAS